MQLHHRVKMINIKRQFYHQVLSYSWRRLCAWALVYINKFCRGPKFAISHWLSRSPLTQCWRYRAARDSSAMADIPRDACSSIVILWLEAFVEGVGYFERKFQTEGGIAHKPLLVSENYKWLPFRAVSKYPQWVVWFCHKARVWRTDRQTDGQTEFRQWYRALHYGEMAELRLSRPR